MFSSNDANSGTTVGLDWVGWGESATGTLSLQFYQKIDFRRTTMATIDLQQEQKQWHGGAANK